MGIIIIGIILLVILTYVSVRNDWRSTSTAIYIAFVIYLSVAAQLIIHGTPIERTLIKKTEIVSLSDGMNVSGGGLFYVQINSNDSYSYYYEVDSDLKQSESEKSYKQGTVVGDNITIIEYENSSNEEPALYKYESGTRGNFWTFDIDGKKDEYVFRVPKGTVVQQYELNGR